MGRFLGLDVFELGSNLLEVCLVVFNSLVKERGIALVPVVSLQLLNQYNGEGNGKSVGTGEVNASYSLSFLLGKGLDSSSLPLVNNQLAPLAAESPHQTLRPHNIHSVELQVEDACDPVNKLLVGLLSFGQLLGLNIGLLDFSEPVTLEKVVEEFHVHQSSGSPVMDGLETGVAVLLHELEGVEEHNQRLEESDFLEVDSDVQTVLLSCPLVEEGFTVVDLLLDGFDGVVDLLALEIFSQNLNVIFHKFLSHLDLLDNLGDLGLDVGLFFVLVVSLGLNLDEKGLDEANVGLDHTLGDGAKDNSDLVHLRKESEVGRLLAGLLGGSVLFNSLFSILKNQKDSLQAESVDEDAVRVDLGDPPPTDDSLHGVD